MHCTHRPLHTACTNSRSCCRLESTVQRQCTHDCQRLSRSALSGNMSSHSDVVRRLAGIDRLWSRAEYSMTDFIARHGQRIPVILYISEGYSGADDLHSISVEDVRETNSQSLTFIGVAGVHWGGGQWPPQRIQRRAKFLYFPPRKCILFSDGELIAAPQVPRVPASASKTNSWLRLALLSVPRHNLSFSRFSYL